VGAPTLRKQIVDFIATNPSIPRDNEYPISTYIWADEDDWNGNYHFDKEYTPEEGHRALEEYVHHMARSSANGGTTEIQAFCILYNVWVRVHMLYGGTKSFGICVDHFPWTDDAMKTTHQYLLKRLPCCEIEWTGNHYEPLIRHSSPSDPENVPSHRVSCNPSDTSHFSTTTSYDRKLPRNNLGILTKQSSNKRMYTWEKENIASQQNFIARTPKVSYNLWSSPLIYRHLAAASRL
jgi:hypothetical protein